jgi:hypothetical protein
LSEYERVYVVLRRGVSGIITRADLRKPPVRLLIFGLVSLLDMHLSYWTRELFPNDSWREQLTEARQTKVAELLAARKLRNEEISEIDCLQLCDKRDILVGNEQARTTLDLGSKKKATKTLKSTSTCEIDWLTLRPISRERAAGPNWQARSRISSAYSAHRRRRSRSE